MDVTVTASFLWKYTNITDHTPKHRHMFKSTDSYHPSHREAQTPQSEKLSTDFFSIVAVIAAHPVSHPLLWRDMCTVNSSSRETGRAKHFSSCLFYYILNLYNLIQRFATCWDSGSHWSCCTVRYYVKSRRTSQK